MKSSARWIIENARVTRVNDRGKVTFVDLAIAGYNAGTTDFHSITAFSRNSLTFIEGQSVTVKGDLSKRKPPEGQKNWTTELVAREVTPGDENLTVAMPARRLGGKPASDSRQSDGVPIGADDDIPF